LRRLQQQVARYRHRQQQRQQRQRH
jgi:hypothetical protein